MIKSLQNELEKVYKLKNQILDQVKLSELSDENSVNIEYIVEPMTIRKIDKNVTIEIPIWANKDFKVFLIKMSSLERTLIVMSQFCKQIIDRDISIGKELELKLNSKKQAIDQNGHSSPDVPLEKLIQIYKPELWISNGSICFSLNIPVVSKEKFNAYKILNIPSNGFIFNISSEIIINEEKSTKLELSKEKIEFIEAGIIYYQKVSKLPLMIANKTFLSKRMFIHVQR